MGAIRYVADRLSNLVAGLGTSRDKASASFYVDPCLSDHDLMTAYRVGWMPRKIVDIPALDATRNWRAWQADAQQIERIEAEEKRLGVQAKILDALTRARLFGGAAVLIGTGDANPDQPLSPERINAGGVKYLTVLNRRHLSAGDLETDPLSEQFGRPSFYRLVSAGRGEVQIHPSRMVIFTGAPHPDPELATGLNFGWGDSILTAVMSAVTNSDSTAANVASLVFEAKVDVFRIPELMNNMGDPEYRARVLERFRLAAVGKGINGALVMDKEEEYQQKNASFASLTDVLMAFVQLVAGAADIPVTRLLGQTPGGLQSTGEADLRNYYDRVAAMQTLTMGPAMRVLDECLIRSALGSRPPEVFYTWSSLWQSTASEQSAIGKTAAETIKLLKETQLWADDALAAAATNMLTELGVVPGLEQSVEEFGARPEGEDADPASAVQTPVTDAAPRTLYVSRKVLNADDIIAWAKSQGFETTLPADDLHVTIAYSREPVDWLKVGETWSGDENGRLVVKAGGARLMERFGEATVLVFGSAELSWRHMAIREAGASWDHSDYNPHVTISYSAADVDLRKVEPYRGPIELGPEVFEEVRADWASAISEE